VQLGCLSRRARPCRRRREPALGRVRGSVARVALRPAWLYAKKQPRPLKRLLASLDTVDRVLRGFIDIAEDGRLTLDDLDAVLELTRIAAATGRWAELLRLVNAAETTLSVTRRVEEWGEILERRGGAEQMLDRLDGAGGGVSVTLVVAAAAAAAAVALGAGYLVGNQSSPENDGRTGKAAKTVTETETETETEAAETVTDTVTQTETETTTVFTTRTSKID
jgi:hypothetical protein